MEQCNSFNQEENISFVKNSEEILYLVKNNILDRQYFERIRVLGEGNFGTVHLSRNVQEKVEVAMKMPHCQEFVDGNDMYENEIQILRKNGRKYEEKIFEYLQDVYLANPSAYPDTLIKPLWKDNNSFTYSLFSINEMSAPTLAAMVKLIGEKHISISEFAVIMLDVIDALLFLHRNNLVHLDVKFENIVVWRDNKGKLRGGLVDIGTLSSTENSELQSSTMTLDGQYPSTSYIRNSVISDSMKRDGFAIPAADVYAFLIVLKMSLHPLFYGYSWKNAISSEMLEFIQIQLATQSLVYDASQLQEIFFHLKKYLQNLAGKKVQSFGIMNRSENYVVDKLQKEFSLLVKKNMQKKEQIIYSAHSFIESLMQLEEKSISLPISAFQNVLKEMDMPSEEEIIDAANNFENRYPGYVLPSGTCMALPFFLPKGVAMPPIFGGDTSILFLLVEPNKKTTFVSGHNIPVYNNIPEDWQDSATKIFVTEKGDIASKTLEEMKNKAIALMHKIWSK